MRAVFYFCFSIRYLSITTGRYFILISNRKTKIKYRPVGILKNLIEKPKIKYRPVGILKNLIEKLSIQQGDILF
jgi:hypothetical protein